MICDIVLLNLLRKGSYYKLHKYTFVDEEKGQALSAVMVSVHLLDRKVPL